MSDWVGKHVRLSFPPQWKSANIEKAYPRVVSAKCVDSGRSHKANHRTRSSMILELWEWRNFLEPWTNRITYFAGHDENLMLPKPGFYIYKVYNLYSFSWAGCTYTSSWSQIGANFMVNKSYQGRKRFGNLYSAKYYTLLHLIFFERKLSHRSEHIPLNADGDPALLSMPVRILYIDSKNCQFEWRTKPAGVLRHVF